MTMNKNEYEASIKTNLTTAEALCADLRKLRGLKKLAEGIADAKNLVSFDALDKTIADKDAELKKVRGELQKARRVVKKLEEIEAIEAGTAEPKPKKAASKQPKAKAPAKPKSEQGAAQPVETAA